MLVVQLIAMIGDSDVPLYDNLIKKEVVSTGLTMILLDQLLILFGLAAILLVGVRTTAMQTNMLRYVLLMKKGQLYDQHDQNHGSMCAMRIVLIECTMSSQQAHIPCTLVPFVCFCNVSAMSCLQYRYCCDAQVL